MMVAIGAVWIDPGCTNLLGCIVFPCKVQTHPISFDMAAISSTKGDLLARTRIMFVCLGNICRSPTAEYVCRAQAKARSVLVELSSSGTGNWHSGDSAHPPMVTAAAKKGYDLSPHSAQQVTAEHLKQNDFIVCMDNSNLANV